MSRASRSPALDAFSANFSDNALGPVRTLGRTFRLSIVAMLQMALDLVRGQLKVREAVVMAWYLVSVTALPAFLMAIPFGVIVTIQIGNIINQLGAQSLLGAASGFAVIQQAAPLAAGILLGGAGAECSPGRSGPVLRCHLRGGRVEVSGGEEAWCRRRRFFHFWLRLWQRS